jgi:hypothetical protein
MIATRYLSFFGFVNPVNRIITFFSVHQNTEHSLSLPSDEEILLKFFAG